MMRQVFFTFFLLIASLTNEVIAQELTFTDPRDGEKYTVVKIDSLYWFRENLRYESPRAHCPHTKATRKDCAGGNYYPYQELEVVCPSFWRAAHQTDWEVYFDYMLDKKDVPEPKRDTFLGEFFDVMFLDTSGLLQLFDTNNLLELKGLGWIQGKRWRSIGTNTQWAKGSIDDDPKFHIHIGPNGAVRHTHTHHIIDKPRKTRKFMVKCVCEEQEFANFLQGNQTK